MAADNVFTSDPYSQSLENEERALAQGLSPVAPPAPAPQEPRQSLLSDFERLASKTQVPVNVLLAYADHKQAPDQAQALAVATEAAERFGSQLQRGDKIEQIIAADLGDDTASGALLGKAKELGAQLYPDHQPVAQKDPGAFGRLGLAFQQGEAAAISRGHKFTRDMSAALEEGALGRSLHALRSKLGLTKDGETPETRAEEIRTASPSPFEAMADQTLEAIGQTGFKVTEWSDIRGIGSAISFIGENLATSLPQMGTAIASGGFAPMSQIILLGAEANEELKERTDLDEATRVSVAAGAGSLMWGLESIGLGAILGGVLPSSVATKATSGKLASWLANKGVAPSAARVMQAAVVEGSTEMMQEGIVMAATSASGGEYEAEEVKHRLIQAFTAGGGVGGALRAAGEPFYSEPDAAPAPDVAPDAMAAPEGAPEVPLQPSEGIAPQMPVDDTPTSAVIPDAPAKGPMQAAMDKAEPQPLQEPRALQSAMETTAQGRFGDFAAGDPINVISSDGEVFEGQFVAEGMDFVTVMLEGERQQIPMDEFDQGGLIEPREQPASQQADNSEAAEDFDPIDDADAVWDAAQDFAQASPATLSDEELLDPTTLLPREDLPTDEALGGAFDDALQEVAAEDGVTSQQVDKPESQPVAEELPEPQAQADEGDDEDAGATTQGTLRTSKGKPFASEKVLRQAMRNRRLDPADYTITAEGEGFVAVPIAAQAPAPAPKPASEPASQQVDYPAPFEPRTEPVAGEFEAEGGTITVSDTGPWDFDRSFPSPDLEKTNALGAEGRNDFDLDAPETVVPTLQESLGEAVAARQAATEWLNIMDQLKNGAQPPKSAGFKRGISRDKMMQEADKAHTAALEELSDIEATLRGVFTDKAVDDMAKWISNTAQQLDKAPTTTTDTSSEPASQQVDPSSNDDVQSLTLPGKRGKQDVKFAQINLRKWPEGYDATYDYDVPGLAGGTGGTKHKTFYATPQEAYEDAAGNIARHVEKLTEPREGAVSKPQASAAKAIMEWLGQAKSEIASEPASQQVEAKPQKGKPFYPNRQLGMQHAASNDGGHPLRDDVAFGNIALANMQPGDEIRGIGEVVKVTAKQIQLKLPTGKTRRISVDSPKFEQLARDVGGLVSASQHGVDTGNVLDAIKRDPAFSYDDRQIPQLSDTVRGTKDGPSHSVVKDLTAPRDARQAGLPAGQKAVPEGKGAEAQESIEKQTGKPVTITLHRGVKPGVDPKKLQDGGRFLSPDKNIARQYAGVDGTIETEEATFENPLIVGNWFDAKKELGLPNSATMQDIVQATKSAGYDALNFQSKSSGDEWVDVREPASKPASQKAAPEGQGANPGATGYSYKLADALELPQQKLLAKHRGADVGNLIGDLDAAARRAEAALRADGLDIRDFDAMGRDTSGRENLWAHTVREAEALASDLLTEAKQKKTGDLPHPVIDENTGELADDQEQTTTFEAVQWLFNLEALSPPLNETQAGRATPQGEGDTTPMAPEKVFPAPAKTENIDLKINRVGYIEQDLAAARLKFWKDSAKSIGKTKDNSGKVVISLFDYTGHWAQPWRDAGYRVLQHDIKTGSDMLVHTWITEQIEEARAEGFEIVGVLSACPCKTFSGAGARWWEGLHDVESKEAVEKVFGPSAVAVGAKSPLEYNQMLYQATKDVIELANPTLFHALENPIGRIKDKTDLPIPTMRFHPHNFGDPYTKRTQIWGDVQADLPTANVDPVDGSKMQSKLRGDDALQKEQRSETPLGFAYAFFMANDPDAREVKDQTADVVVEQKPARKPDSQQASLPSDDALGDAFDAAMAEVKAQGDKIEKIEAEAAKVDTDPTDAQKEAGNYKKGRFPWNGLELVIETPKGATRSGVDPDGKPWSVTMPAHYGDIKRTEGADGDPLDFYMGDYPDSNSVTIVNQVDPDTGKFDEHKIILGARSVTEALDIYRAGFSDGSGDKRLGSSSTTDVSSFKGWMKDQDTTKPTVSPRHSLAETDALIKSELYLARLDLPQGWSLPEERRTVELRDPSGKLRLRRPIEGGGDVKRVTEALKGVLQEFRKIHGPKPRAATEAAKSAASNTAEGFADLAKGLGALFGGGDPTRVNSGPTFDKETYEKAKPYFTEGFRRLNMAGADLKDMMLALIRQLQDAGMTLAQIERMKPYAVQFVKDVQSGGVDFQAKSDTLDAAQVEDSHDAGSDQTDSDQPLETEPSEDGEKADPRADSSTGRGRGQTGDGGTGSTGSRGRGSSQRVAGRAEQDGSESPTRSLSPNLAARRDPDALTERAGQSPGNFVIADTFALGEGTAGEKIKANLSAIQLAKKLESENRFATTEEQTTLARYVGWGGLKTVFDVKKEGATDQYGRAQAELRQILTADEYNAASASVRNAHYTARGVVTAMWDVMRGFGFTGGRALEPTVGTGNFLGLQPAEMAAATEWHAAEMDTITGLIAKHLYPEAAIMAGTPFEKAPFAEGVFDVAIGNPPFGANTASDPRRPDLDGMKIHNYVIAKSGEHLRPGGIMAMVVTHRFLDTADPQGRAELAKRFDFIGAVRLPNDAFAANAGTEVTTDIVFLQKRQEGAKADKAAAWLDTNGKVTENGEDIRVNRYFQENPDHILGRSAMDGTMYAARGAGRGEYTVHSDGRDIGAAIAEIAATKWADVTLGAREAQLEAVSATLNESTLPVGGMALVDGVIKRRGMDDAAGNAVVEDITPDSVWSDDGAPWARVLERAKAIEGAHKTADGLTEDLITSFVDAAQVAMTAKGRKAKPNKAEKAVYDLLDDLTSPNFFWRHNGALDEISTAVARKTLGEGNHARLRGLLDLRQKTLDLIRAERMDSADIEAQRSGLNAAYDAFQTAFGYIGDPQNVRLLKGDVGAELGLEARYTPAEPAQKADPAKGLEASSRKASSAQKADILSKRVNFPYREVTEAKDAQEGVTISLSERGRVDLPYIAALTGQPVANVIAELSDGDAPTIFLDPENDTYVHREEYLSGNVRHKLNVAREHGAEINIAALEAAQPSPLDQARIKPTIRSQWVPESVFEEFLLDLGVQDPKVSIVAAAGIMRARSNGQSLSDYGMQFNTKLKSVTELFQSAASGKAIKIMVRDPDGKSFEDKPASEKANAMVARLSKSFEEWAYQDDTRAKQIVDAFNEKMNTHVRRVFDGRRYLKTVGQNPAITLRRTQTDAAWRMIQSPAVLLDHVVGAGKTFTAITGVMERRRLGLSRKPLIVVPNHLVLQWARDFYTLYPGARILAATPDDFTKKNRRRLFARMATGDYDAIIIGHSSLSYIQTPAADEKALVDEKLKELRDTLNELRSKGESGRTLTQIENKIDGYGKKLEDLQDRPKDEIGFDFADMGIDYLVVDEAHEFKNLEYATGAERVVGMNDPKGSKKAFDLYAKLRGLQGRGGGVAFATGTPVSNSLVEVFTMMSYLAHDELVLRNQANFDAWSSAYALTETRMEYTATQTLKPRRVLSGLTNLSSMGQLYEQFADVITMDTLKALYSEEVAARNKAKGENARTEFPVPKVKSGGRILAGADLTPAQSQFMDYLVARMQTIQTMQSDKDYAKKDNPLWVLTDARKMSLDIRTVDPTAPRDENGKVARSAEKIKDIYDRWDSDKGTQMVFSDLSTPTKFAPAEARRLIRAALGVMMPAKEVTALMKQWDSRPYVDQWRNVEELRDTAIATSDGDKVDLIEEHFAKVEDAEATMSVADVGFSVYDDLRAALVEKGIPAREVAFIHDYNTPEQKARLFAAMNDGRVRVLVGSSAKMGAGTNAQERLVALHHLDAPWRPSDIEQREGRIIRQGNALYERDPDNFEVEIYAYSTNGTSDTVMWQVLERKAAAIEQFRSAALDDVQEEGGDSDQYAEFMASSTGNPVFRHKLEAERDLVELTTETSGALLARSRAKRFLAEYDTRVADLQTRLTALGGLKLGEVTYKDLTADAATLKAALSAAQKAYQKDQAAYLERRAASDARANALSQQGMPLDKINKTLKAEKMNPGAAPAKPTLVSEAVTSKSDYAAVVREILTDARALGEGAALTFKMGNATLRLRKSDSGFDKQYIYTLALDAGGVWLALESWHGTNPVQSTRLQTQLSPDALGAFLSENIGYRKEEAARLTAELPRQKALAEQEIDTSARDHTAELVQWYKAEVALAEADANTKRAERVNPYIMSDTKRPLRQFKGEKGVMEMVEHDGVTYATTGLAATDPARWGWRLEEAERQGDKMRVILPIKRKEGAVEDIGDVLHEPVPVKQRRVFHSRWLRKAKYRDGNQIAALRDELQLRLQEAGLGGRLSLQIAEALPDYRVANSGETRQMRGYYTDKLIALALNHDPVLTFDHELIHALRDPQAWGRPYGLFTRGEWDRLTTWAKNHRMFPVAQQVYPDIPLDAQIEEVIAEGYAQWRKRTDVPPTAIARIFRKMRNVLRAIKEAFSAHSTTNVDDLFARIRAGDIGQRSEKTDASGTDLVRKMGKISKQEKDAKSGSSLVERMGQQGQDKTTRHSLSEQKTVSKVIDAAVAAAAGVKAGAKDARRRLTREGVSNALTDAMNMGRGKYSVLGTVPSRPLFSELGQKMPAARVYLRTKERMDALRNDWHNRTDEVAQAWRKLISKDPSANEKMMDIMHRATIAQVDPSGAFTGFASKYHMDLAANARADSDARQYAQGVVNKAKAQQATHTSLRAEFAALPPEFQSMFKVVRKEYAALADAHEAAVLEHLEKAADAGLARAEARHKARLEEIERLEMSPEERAEEVAEADLAFSRAKKRNGWTKRAKIAALRNQFESNRLKGPYFPLARFGDFFVAARDSAGELVSFSLFENQRDQKAEIARVKAEGHHPHHGVMSNKKELKGAIDQNFVADVEEILGDADVPEEVMDSVWQRWLETLPDTSIRTKRIHRKGSAGYTPDAFRAFGKQVFHGAHQLARLKYAVDLEQSLQDLREQASNADDPNRAQLVVNEMARRHEFTMNPTGHAWATTATAGAFLWYMAASPAAALVNLTQTSVVGTPILGAAFAKQGVGGAAKELTKAMVDFTRAKGHPMVGKRLTAGEKRALTTAYRRGVIDKTQSHDLAGVAESGVEYSDFRARWMGRLSFFFHHTERMNREVTFLAAYRMARTAGLGQQASIDKAADLTWKTHFDYQNTSRPRVMQNDTAKVVLVFRNFTVNMLYRLFRDSHQALVGATPQERREARAQLFGITASMMLHAGIRGTWGYGLIMGILALALPGDSDELEEKFKRALVGDGDNMLRRNVAGMMLNGVPGHLTGVSLTERIGMPNLWFREPNRDMEGRDLYLYYLHELLGPAIGIPGDILQGASNVLAGEGMRGVEGMVPKFLRDILKSGRYLNEGVQNWNGDPIVEDVAIQQALVQALGFTPAIVAERYQTANRMRNAQRRIQEQRKDIVADVRNSALEGRRLSPKLRQSMAEFNETYPEVAITGETIRRSMSARKAASARNEFGTQLSPKLNRRVREGVSPQIYK